MHRCDRRAGDVADAKVQAYIIRRYACDALTQRSEHACEVQHADPWRRIPQHCLLGRITVDDDLRGIVDGALGLGWFASLRADVDECDRRLYDAYQISIGQRLAVMEKKAQQILSLGAALAVLSGANSRQRGQSPPGETAAALVQ
jgi:hypothetical protein